MNHDKLGLTPTFPPPSSATSRSSVIVRGMTCTLSTAWRSILDSKFWSCHYVCPLGLRAFVTPPQLTSYVCCRCSSPTSGTFATCGSDGLYVFWDKEAKQRLKLFKRNNQPITCSTFSPDGEQRAPSAPFPASLKSHSYHPSPTTPGNIFAYALSYDWSKGVDYHDKSVPPQIMLHPVVDGEIAPKRK